jgi:ABC-type uncharacterized transport system
MKPASPNTPPATDPQTVKPSGWRPLILVPVFFLLGAVLAGVWFKYGKHAAGSLLPGQELSGQTVDLLRHLNSPVEIRFYSVLPPESAPEPLQDFSRRVDHLLSEFQSANDSKIRVTRNVSTSGANADAASADGIHPFNLDKGDACFLGLTVVCGERKESLPQIQPEWEPALEFDLARAILQVTATLATSVVKASAPVSPEVTNEVIRLIPDLKGTSLEDGTRLLREAAFEEFTAAGIEMENKLQAAQQQLSDAQNGQSEAEQQAAMKHLQEVQLEQGQKYKQIAARLQAELAVFQQMKAAASAAK